MAPPNLPTAQDPNFIVQGRRKRKMMGMTYEISCLKQKQQGEVPSAVEKRHWVPGGAADAKPAGVDRERKKGSFRRPQLLRLGLVFVLSANPSPQTGPPPVPLLYRRGAIMGWVRSCRCGATMACRCSVLSWQVEKGWYGFASCSESEGTVTGGGGGVLLSARGSSWRVRSGAASSPLLWIENPGANGVPRQIGPVGPHLRSHAVIN